jgi:hypothetical protein
MKKTHVGSKLDEFLQEDRLLEGATATATKRVIAHQIAMEMKRRRITKVAMASRMKTSRAALDRLLDPNNPSVTIGTLEKAAVALNRRLKVDASPVVVNLASQEYFKAVDLKALKARVVECVFEEYRDGRYKIISFMAKRARGLMVHFAVSQRLMTPADLQGFTAEGYAFDAAASATERMVFRRGHVEKI